MEEMSLLPDCRLCIGASVFSAAGAREEDKEGAEGPLNGPVGRELSSTALRSVASFFRLASSSASTLGVTCPFPASAAVSTASPSAVLALLPVPIFLFFAFGMSSLAFASSACR